MEKRVLSSVFIGILLLLISKAQAQSGSGIDTVAGPNSQVALADQVTDAITLTGKATDKDGRIVSYSWRKILGGAATLSNANTLTLKVSGLSPGKYVFRLTATDDKGGISFDDITVTVKGSTAPVAKAGADKIITLPTQSVSFSGSGEGTITSYSWRQIYGKPATLTYAKTSNLKVSVSEAGNYKFRLTVTDNTGATAMDDVTLTVKENTAPVAKAGADKTIALPTQSVSFSGSGEDIGGTIASYSWKQIYGKPVVMSNANTSTLKVSVSEAGNYKFRLTVTDNSGATAMDDVTLTVKKNTAPIAKAGADKIITLPTPSASFSGSGEGTITSYSWRQIYGKPAILTNASTATLKVSVSEAGNYKFRLTVTDNSGATAIDDVTLTVKKNTAPIAKAGADKIITLPTRSTSFTGRGEDIGGTITAYSWRQIYGKPATLTYANTATLRVSVPGAGNYKFRLTVTDNGGATAIDDVTLTVKEKTAVAASGRLSSPDPFKTESLPAEEAFDFMDKKYPPGYDYAVIIFDENGKKVFQGKWSNEIYNEVIYPGKLYLYQVIQNGRKIDSGKFVRGD